jgi:ectoine hydroxylase-related dioxygenase (phytanoyl-CoA dioxygenase family)
MALDTGLRVAAAVTPELVSAYQRDGACCVRGLFTPDEIALLAAGIESNLALPSERAIVASQPGDPGRFFEDFCNWQRIDEYRRFIEESPAAAAAAVLMGGSPVRLFHDHLLVKEAGTQQRTPWHQDQPYYNVDGRQNVSMWIPVDPVARVSTPEFIAASHLGPWLMPRSFMDKQARWFPEGSLADLPDIDSNPGAFRILGWALQPGDMVCFNMLTLHAAPGSVTRRRAFSLRLLGRDMRHAPRPWKTSPHFPGLDAELAAGAPMEHPLFPQLWPAPH